MNALESCDIKEPSGEHDGADQHYENARSNREFLCASNEAVVELLRKVEHRRSPLNAWSKVCGGYAGGGRLYHTTRFGRATAPLSNQISSLTITSIKVKWKRLQNIDSRQTSKCIFPVRPVCSSGRSTDPNQ